MGVGGRGRGYRLNIFAIQIGNDHLIITEKKHKKDNNLMVISPEQLWLYRGYFTYKNKCFGRFFPSILINDLLMRKGADGEYNELLPDDIIFLCINVDFREKCQEEHAKQ